MFYRVVSRFGFSRYMRLDHSDAQEKGNAARGTRGSICHFFKSRIFVLSVHFIVLFCFCFWCISDFGFQRLKSVLDEEYEFENEAYPKENRAKLDQQLDNALFPDYGDDYDDYVLKRKRKLFSLVVQETNNSLKNSSDTNVHIDKKLREQGKDNITQPQPQKPAEPVPTQALKHYLSLKQNRSELKFEGPVKKVQQKKTKGKLKQAKRQKLKSVETAERPGQTNPPIPADRELPKAKERPAIPSEQLSNKQRHIQKLRKMNHTQIQRIKDSQLQPIERDAPLPKPTVAKQRRYINREMELQQAASRRFTTPNGDANRPLVSLMQRNTDTRKSLRKKEIEMNMPLQEDVENNIHRAKMVTRDKMVKKRVNSNDKEDHVGVEDEVYKRAESRRDAREGERDSLWGPGGDFEGADDEDLTPAPVFDPEVNWSQTFQVNHLDLQAQRSDWIDLRCNASGNLLLQSSDALPVVNAFMDKLNKKHHG